MSEETFSGFVVPTSNYFKMPNDIINVIARIKNMSELKVIIYLIRHTWGYQEYGICKTISTDEFMKGRRRADGSRIDAGTGLSNRSVIDGLRKAEKHGYVICHTDESDKGRVTKSYMLNMKSACETSSQGTSEDTSQPPVKEVHTPCEDTSQPPVKEVQRDCETFSHRSEKERERHTGKTPMKERENPRADELGEDLSLSPSSINPLLNSLTEEQANFWTRWCAISKNDHQKLNKHACELVKFFAPLGLSTEDVQCLYDEAYARIREFARSKDIPEEQIKRPRLGNLKNVYADWENMHKQKEKSKSIPRFSSGSGGIPHYDFRDAPPIVHRPLPQERRNRSVLSKIEFGEGIPSDHP